MKTERRYDYELTGELFHINGENWLVPENQEIRFNKDTVILFDGELYKITGVPHTYPARVLTLIISKI